MDPAIQGAIDAAVQAALQAQALNAQAAIDAAVQAAIQAQALNAPAVAPVAVPDITSPGQIVGPLNLSLTHVMKIHKASIAPLDAMFDGKPENLRMFLHGIKSRGNDFGWTETIFNVPDVGGVHHNFLRNYGRFTDAELRAFAVTYLNIRPITRLEQASHQLATMIMCSISDAFKTRVVARNNDYTINNLEDGIMMLKVVLSLVQVDTKATVSIITEQIYSLDTKLQELDYNIQDFNIHVETLVDALTCRDEQVPNLVPVLFKVYKKVPDEMFCEFMRGVESRWEINDPAIVTHENVATLALKKWQGLVQKGEWKAETKKDEFILALQAENEKLRSGKTKSPGTGSKEKAGKQNKHTGKWAWKAIPPKEGEKKEKMFEGTAYVHCPNHEGTSWVLASGHKDGCKLDKGKSDDTNQGIQIKAPEVKAPSKEQLTYAKALASVMDDDDDDE